MLRKIIFVVLGFILLILLFSAIKTFGFPDARKTTVSKTQTTPYETKIVESNTLAPQESKVQQSGMPGLTKITYEVQTKNGKEISRREIKRESVRESTPQIIQKNSAVAQTTPVTTVTPNTGPAETTMIAIGLLVAAGTFYARSKQKLIYALARHN